MSDSGGGGENGGRGWENSGRRLSFAGRITAVFLLILVLTAALAALASRIDVDPWLLFLLLLLTQTGAAPVLAADIPVFPYAEVSVATEGPLSLLSAPDGSGLPLTQAFDSTGQPVDGTITMTLYDDYPPWGNPVAYFPAEDIWLADMTGSLTNCPAGTIPDGDTDANGTTTWTRALYAGGHIEPAGGNQLVIMVMGGNIEGGDLPDFRLNSADLNGDLVVNLTDVWHFTMGYFGPYAYTTDLHWDGAVNLSDLAELARAVGTECP